jgi:uncharacterized membrane protein
MLDIHEVLIQFPFVLFLSAFLFAIIGTFYKRGLFKEIIFWNLLVGIITGSAAVYIDFLEQELITDYQMQEMLGLRRRSIYIIAAFFITLFLWLGIRKKKMRRQEYLAWAALLMLGTASVAYHESIRYELSSQKEAMRIRMENSPVKKEMNYGWNY